MNRVLLTGASGFIGTNLVEDLISKGYEVCNIDIKPPQVSKRNNIWKNVDITDYLSFEKAILDFKPDYVIHLAARTDLDGKTLEDYSANIVGVENLMKIIHF